MLFPIASRKGWIMSRGLWRVRQDVPMTSHHPHQQVAAALRADILNGTFTPGQKLPGQRELGEKYDVAPNTMAQALRLLEAEGLVEMTPRRRSRVLQPAPSLEARLHEDGLLRPTDRAGLGYDTLRNEARGGEAQAAEALGLAPSSPLHVRQAVLLHTGAPWAVQTLFTLKAVDVAGGDQAATVAPFVGDATRRETRHTSRWSARHAYPEERELLRTRHKATVLEDRRVGFIDERSNSYLLTVVRADRVTILAGSGS